MRRLSNIRIGIKLAVISGISILLVLTMIGSQMLNNGAMREASSSANLQQQIAHDVMSSKAYAMALQVAVRDIRLAQTPENLQNALRRLESAQQTAQGAVAAAAAKMLRPENRARAERLKSLIDQYVAGAKEIATIRTQAIELQMRRPVTEETAARVESLNALAADMAQERTLPLAEQIGKLADEAVNVATQIAGGEIAAVAQAMHRAEITGLSIGTLAAVLLVGAAIFGSLSIARPLSRMAGVLNELTQDRIVDVPYVDRGDEIGDIAKATEVFKHSIAEKVLNFRVRTALDTVRTSVMIADDQYNIMYMNNSIKDMFREIEGELRKHLPQFDSSRLIGVNMDIFHKNPAHQRKLLDTLTGTYEGHITIGNVRLDVVATAVIDKNGKRSGTVVEWRNVTAEKAIETEVDGIVQAAVAGDFSRRVALEGKKGFMLNLANGINALCENTAKALSDIVDMMGALASGDLTKRITADYQGMFAKLKGDTNAMAERISATIAEIKASAREVTNAAAEISASTTDLSQRTEEQAASLEQTSASMEEIAATVKKNAENAQQANQSAAGTREVADRGGQVVAKAVEAMARIEESSRKISDIIGVIDEIARQTNLLALNAAVEAARAGEAGRGFAVVASEVRSLAQRSSQAAKDIKDLITNSNGQVKEGVELVNRAGTALNEIVESIKKVAAIVSDIAAASSEQATGLEQINKALAQMDEVTQQNSALVEQNAATAKTLEQQAKAMDSRVAFFRIDSSVEADVVSRAAAGGATAQRATAAATTKPQTAARPKPEVAAKRIAGNGGGPVGRMQAAVAAAVQKDLDWKEF
ncbi:MAG TPA: methyl-accepting chemotaxis protein [Xanthobacteraceae bacterium]|nr:methyl-accepting chemotaxis protein [Xanthobacteraceae bacterium]